VAATDRVGIEFLSVFGLPPVEFVELVADLGCRYLSTGLTSAPGSPLGHAPFSLRDDPALRREFVAAMRDRDVSISLGEGMIVREGVDIRESVADLDVMSELGIGAHQHREPGPRPRSVLRPVRRARRNGAPVGR
jgi:hypothetical protein